MLDFRPDRDVVGLGPACGVLGVWSVRFLIGLEGKKGLQVFGFSWDVLDVCSNFKTPDAKYERVVQDAWSVRYLPGDSLVLERVVIRDVIGSGPGLDILAFRGDVGFGPGQGLIAFRPDWDRARFRPAQDVLGFWSTRYLLGIDSVLDFWVKRKATCAVAEWETLSVWSALYFIGIRSGKDVSSVTSG